MTTHPGARRPVVADDGYGGDPRRCAQGGVRQINVPPAARDLSTLRRIDYADAFLVKVDDPKQRTAEQWARSILDDAPPNLYLTLWGAWIMLGLRLASPFSKRHVLGWEVRDTAADHVLLGARSRIGMPAELLVTRRADALLFDTFVQQGNPLARAVWAATKPTHHRVLPALLRQFRKRLDRREPAS
jgi:hypothetical protein